MGAYESREFTMPFGKFKGLPLRLITTGYLEWLASRPDLRQPLAGRVFAELARRRVEDEAVEPILDDAPDRETIDALVRAGVKTLAKKVHPDVVGGDGELMKRVNAAADWLRERLTGAWR